MSVEEMASFVPVSEEVGTGVMRDITDVGAEEVPLAQLVEAEANLPDAASRLESLRDNAGANSHLMKFVDCLVRGGGLIHDFRNFITCYLCLCDYEGEDGKYVAAGGCDPDLDKYAAMSGRFSGGKLPKQENFFHSEDVVGDLFNMKVVYRALLADLRGYASVRPQGENSIMVKCLDFFLGRMVSENSDDFKLEEVDLADFLREAFVSLRPLIGAGGADLELAIASDLDSSRVMANEAVMAHIVFNLVNNAMKVLRATETKNPKIRLVLGQDDQGDLLFSVEDNGPGFARADKTEYLEKGTRDEVYEGTGTGLGIVKEACGYMDAELDLGNLPEGGAKVEMSFEALKTNVVVERVRASAKDVASIH